MHPGHLILSALVILGGFLGWQVLVALSAPLPAAPRFVMPLMADRALLARIDPFFPAGSADSAALPVTALPLSLHGVRGDTATGRGAAFIASGDGEQKLYQVGEGVGQGVTLVAIAADHVVIDRAGARETLWLDNGGDTPVHHFDPAGPTGGGNSSSDGGLAPGIDHPGADSPDPAGPDGGAALVAAAPPRKD